MIVWPLLALASLTAVTAQSKGDTQCVQLMCISANVTGSTTEYTLKGSGAQKMAWMAMGFGSTMANSPMVIMWPNSDGSVTLSQRMAPAEVMPTVQSSPPRTASFNKAASDFTASQPTLAYTIPSNSDTKQNVIWAFGIVPPSGSAVDAQIQQHLDSGTFTLDLTKTLSSSSSSTGGGSSPTSIPTYNNALTMSQMKYLAHGIIMFLAFLVFLPFGALVARYLRILGPGWFIGHWIFQVALAAPLIIVGFALAVNTVPAVGQLNDTHKKLGVALFVLYLAQVTYGVVIHFFKPKNAGRPVQNYGHAVFGLLIIALAYWQVYTGFNEEWPKVRGEPAPDSVKKFWIAWIVILPIIYLAGLALLPKQFSREKNAIDMREK